MIYWLMSAKCSGKLRNHATKQCSIHAYDIYKKDHPAPTKEVVIVVDGYQGLEKHFLEQIPSIYTIQK